MIDPLNRPAYLFGASSSGLPSPAEFRQAVVGSAAQALGMNVPDVRSALQNGSSLADLAQKQGVSSDALVSAVAQGIESLGSSAGGLPGAPDVSQMAQRIVDRKGGIGGHHHRRTSSDPDGDGDVDKGSGSDGDSGSSPLAIVSNALGMSQNDLLAALESGTSLTDLLTRNGLTQQSLAAALGGGGLIDTTA